MEYANVVWGGTYESDMLKLERIHIDGMRLVTGATARSNIANLYNDACTVGNLSMKDVTMLCL